MRAITGLSCVFIDTPDLAASRDFYSRCFGLEVAGETPDAVALSAGAQAARRVVLRQAPSPGLAALEYGVRTESDLDALRIQLATAHAPLLDDTLPFPEGAALTVRDPDGGLIRVRVADSPSTARGGADAPEDLSHVVLNSPHPERLTGFYVDALGFRVSDRYERELLTFLRADSPQHHCVGVAQGERSGLNHFALDTGDLDALMKSVGRMKRAGYEPIWGPGRHGPGGNVFCYFADPTGLVAEFTCEVLQIHDDEAWTPQEWARTPANGNVWGTGAPSELAIRLMSGERDAASSPSPM